MRTLSWSAKLYLAATYLAGLTAVVCALRGGLPLRGNAWEVALFLIVAVFAAGKKITLLRHRKRDYVCSVSLGFAITFAALLRFGPSVAVLVAVACGLSASLYPKRHPLHQLGFNVALPAFTTWVAGYCFLWMNGGTLALEPLRAFPVVAVTGLLYFVINTGGVATVLALYREQNPVAVWRNALLWLAPSYVAGACVSTLALLLFGKHTEAILLFGSPLAYLIFQSYADHSARLEEKEQHLREKQGHIEELQQGQTRLEGLYLATIKSLALAIDAKDQYTHQHILRVQGYAVATAHQMGLTGQDLEAVNTGALLHDIGKLGVPEHILLKPGPLTPEEYEQVKRHPEIGAAILDPVEFPWPVLPVVKYHHEKWDGTGYPEGLAGENIPLTARILSVADVYDALTSHRSYRRAWTHERAVAEIRRGAGTYFDPDVVDAFLDVAWNFRAQGIQVPSDEAARDLTPWARGKVGQAVRDIGRATSVHWVLYEVNEALSGAADLQEALRNLARKLQSIFPGVASAVLLRDGLAGGMVMQTAGDPQPDALVAPQSNLVVPIVHEGETLGTLNLRHAEPDAFSADDRQLLELVAHRAAVTLHQGLQFDRVRSHAQTDPLTGLYNVRHLRQSVEEQCQNRSERFAVLCLDLDDFKPVNDTLGHQEGDRVLREIGNLFRESVRDADLAARYGGDEFVIVLHDAGPVQAEAMAQRLRDAVAAHPFNLEPLRVGVSVGWSCFPADGLDCAALLAVADARMYQNKAARRPSPPALEATPRHDAGLPATKRFVRPRTAQEERVFRLAGGAILPPEADDPGREIPGRRRRKCLMTAKRTTKRPPVGSILRCAVPDANLTAPPPAPR